MKLNLEIDIDWIDEDSSIDEAVKQSIIDQVINTVGKKVEEKVVHVAEQKINDTIINKIDELVEKTFNEFMSKEVSITDSYGSVVNTYENIEAVIKEKFDNYLTQKVDEKGKVSSYGNQYTRITYFIDKQLKEFSDKFTTDAVKQVSDEIKHHVKSGLTQKLGSELMKVLKVEKLIGLPESKD